MGRLEEIEKKICEELGGEITIEQILDGFIQQLKEPDKKHPIYARILTYEDSDFYNKVKNGDVSYAVKEVDKNLYYKGLNGWSDQVRFAQLYHSESYAKAVFEKYPNLNLQLVKVLTAEI